MPVAKLPAMNLVFDASKLRYHLGAHRALCAYAARKVGCFPPPPVASFRGVSVAWAPTQHCCRVPLPLRITVASSPIPCLYVPLQTGTLSQVYGDTFPGCPLRDITHAPWGASCIYAMTIECSENMEPCIHTRASPDNVHAYMCPYVVYVRGWQISLIQSHLMLGAVGVGGRLFASENHPCSQILPASFVSCMCHGFGAPPHWQ